MFPVQSLLGPCGIAEGMTLRMCVFVSAATGGQVSFRTGLVPGINEQTAPKLKSRDNIGVLVACLKSMVL